MTMHGRGLNTVLEDIMLCIIFISNDVYIQTACVLLYRVWQVVIPE